jgi:hypothetical protein
MKSLCLSTQQQREACNWQALKQNKASSMAGDKSLESGALGECTFKELNIVWD